MSQNLNQDKERLLIIQKNIKELKREWIKLKPNIKREELDNLIKVLEEEEERLKRLLGFSTED